MTDISSADPSAAISEYWDDFFSYTAVILAEIISWKELHANTVEGRIYKDSKLAELEYELGVYHKFERLISENPKRVPTAATIVSEIDEDTVFLELEDAVALLKISEDELAANLSRTPHALRAFYNRERIGMYRRFGTQKHARIQKRLRIRKRSGEVSQIRERFYFGHEMGSDYRTPFSVTFFIRDEVASYVPERYLTGKELLTLWGRRLKGATRNFIEEMITTAKLYDVHPTLVVTAATPGYPDNPPLEEGMFAVSEIKLCQETDFDLRYPIWELFPDEKEYDERNTLIVEMYKKQKAKGAKNVAERIGQMFNISRQRVEAIVSAYEEKQLLHFSQLQPQKTDIPS